jgi:hypothetical protein
MICPRGPRKPLQMLEFSLSQSERAEVRVEHFA